VNKHVNRRDAGTLQRDVREIRRRNPDAKLLVIDITTQLEGQVQALRSQLGAAGVTAGPAVYHMVTDTILDMDKERNILMEAMDRETLTGISRSFALKMDAAQTPFIYERTDREQHHEEDAPYPRFAEYDWVVVTLAKDQDWGITSPPAGRDDDRRGEPAEREKDERAGPAGSDDDHQEKPAEKDDKAGGITFASLNIVVKRDDNGKPLPLALQDRALSEIDGLKPVIIRVTAVTRDQLAVYFARLREEDAVEDVTLLR